MSAPRLSFQGVKVLKVLRHAAGRLSGADILRALGPSALSGTVYPMLRRFEAGGLLQSVWETDDPHELGRPRRRLYVLTSDGERYAHTILYELQR